MATAIVLGTSRPNGNTHKLVNLYQQYETADVFNLSDFSISTFDYEHLIFATPMYWYAMSGQMKVFFDRLSDLLTIEKELGRGLRGKTCSVLASGVDKQPPECFEQPFKLTATYLGMTYQQMLYCSCAGDFIEQEHSDKLLNHIGLNIG